MDRWSDGPMDRWTDGPMDRWTDGLNGHPVLGPPLFWSARCDVRRWRGYQTSAHILRPAGEPITIAPTDARTRRFHFVRRTGARRRVQLESVATVLSQL